VDSEQVQDLVNYRIQVDSIQRERTWRSVWVIVKLGTPLGVQVPTVTQVEKDFGCKEPHVGFQQLMSRFSSDRGGLH
jgi:hypothetical protein